MAHILRDILRGTVVLNLLCARCCFNLKTMEFKIGKGYSSKTIDKNSKSVSLKGELKGGEHTITTETNTFVMLSDGAWRGGNSLYYKCVK